MDAYAPNGTVQLPARDRLTILSAKTHLEVSTSFRALSNLFNSSTRIVNYP